MPSSTQIILAVLGTASFVAADTCNQNNCYRQFNGAAYTASAQSYCSKYSAATKLTIPPYATQMCSLPAQISSVCACAYPPTATAGCSVTVTVTVTTTFTATSSLPSSVLSLSSSSSKPASITSATLQTAASVIAPVNQCHTNGDNCQRAMEREGGVGATAFCSSWTSAVITNTALLPTYATQCTTNAVSQISSACTCLGFDSSASAATSSQTASSANV